MGAGASAGAETSLDQKQALLDIEHAGFNGTFDKIDADGSGEIDKAEFGQARARAENTARARRTQRERARRAQRERAREPHRDAARARAAAYRPPARRARARRARAPRGRFSFSQTRAPRLGRFCRDAQACRDLGVLAEDAEIDALFARFDVDGSGTISRRVPEGGTTKIV